MSTKKYLLRSCFGQNYSPSTNVPECIKMGSLLLLRVLHSWRKVCQNHVKMIEKLREIRSQKWTPRCSKWRIDSSFTEAAKEKFRAVLWIVLNASRQHFAFRYAHFLWFFMDPNNFRLKINEISMLGAKCYLNVLRSAPDMKIIEFCKVLPGRAQNMIFNAFLKAPHRGFS